MREPRVLYALADLGAAYVAYGTARAEGRDVTGEWEELARAEDRLIAAVRDETVRRCAGLLSTHGEWAATHPQDAYAFLRPALDAQEAT